jgi:DNA-binding response OmpR family regulator
MWNLSKKTTILIADDDPGYLAPLRYFFEDEGWNVIAVATIEDLKRRAMDSDILLVDVKLSSFGHEGITAIATLRKDKQSRLIAPVVFFSVLDESECAVELKSLECRYLWLRKPCSLSTVDATVKKAMEQRY